MTVPYRYRFASDGDGHHVFVVHSQTPEWWHLIATFRDRERAESYCEVENDIADSEFTPRSGETPAPADLPQAPDTKLKRGGVTDNLLGLPPHSAVFYFPEVETPPLAPAASSPVERADADAATDLIQQYVIKDQAPDDVEAATPATKRGGVKRITESQRRARAEKLLDVIVFLCEQGEPRTHATLSAMSGIPRGSIGFYLDQLLADGAIRHDSETGNILATKSSPKPTDGVQAPIYSRPTTPPLDRMPAVPDEPQPPEPHRMVTATIDDICRFLRTRDYVVSMEGGQFRVDRKLLSRADLIEKANKLREQMGKPPFIVRMEAAP